MAVLESQIAADSPAFIENQRAQTALLAEFRGLEARIRDTSARSKEKFDKRGQLLPRQRVALLLDRGAPFLELSTLCGYKMDDDDGDGNISGGGVIVVIGQVSGKRCVILASDSGIKGGAATPMGVDKTLRAQAIALENNLPLIQLIESAGANLFRQAQIFVNGGRMFANLARLSAKGLPIVSVVHGSSTAGGAYQTGLSDYVVVVRGRSRVFLAGPPLLKAATGEAATDEELGGAEMHYHVSGTAEYMAENDADGIRLAREILAKLPGGVVHSERAFAEPRYETSELLGIVPVDYQKPYDVREVIARLVDGSDFLDFKPGFGSHTVTGHAAITGHSIGIVGNNGPIDAAGAAKAAQFIQLCCQANLPVVFLQNTTGYMVGKEAESGGIIKHGSKMIQAVTNMTVPKLTLQIGASFGAGNYGMCGRAFDPRFVFSWPNCRLAVMGGKQAATTMRIVAEEGARRAGKSVDAKALDAAGEVIVKQYDAESSALFATARLWDDGIIDPRDSRNVLSLCLDICHDAAQRSPRASTFGVARM